MGRIFPPVDLGVAHVLWAFPHRAYSNPHWRSQGRQAFRSPLKASTSWVQLPEATPPRVPPRPPVARPGQGSARPRSRVSCRSEKLLPPRSVIL